MLEDQLKELEQTYIETDFSEFEREILFYFLHGAPTSINYNGTYLSPILSWINYPEMHTNYNIILYNASKLEFRELVTQQNFTKYVYADVSTNTLYYYYAGTMGKNDRKNLHIYIWSPTKNP